MSNTSLILKELTLITNRDSCGIYDEYAHMLYQNIQSFEKYIERLKFDDDFTVNEYTQMIEYMNELREFKYKQNEIKTDNIIENLHYLFNHIEMFDSVLWDHLFNSLQDQIGQTIEEENALDSRSPPPTLNEWIIHIINETETKIRELKDELEQITHFSRIVHTPLFQETLSILKNKKIRGKE